MGFGKLGNLIYQTTKMVLSLFTDLSRNGGRGGGANCATTFGMGGIMDPSRLSRKVK